MDRYMSRYSMSADIDIDFIRTDFFETNIVKNTKNNITKTLVYNVINYNTSDMAKQVWLNNNIY